MNFQRIFQEIQKEEKNTRKVELDPLNDKRMFYLYPINNGDSFETRLQLTVVKEAEDYLIFELKKENTADKYFILTNDYKIAFYVHLNKTYFYKRKTGVSANGTVLGKYEHNFKTAYYQNELNGFLDTVPSLRLKRLFSK